MTYLIGQQEDRLERLSPCRVVITRNFGDELCQEKYIFGEFVFYLDAVRTMRKMCDMRVSDLKNFCGASGDEIRYTKMEETCWEIRYKNYMWRGKVEFIMED